MRQLWLGYPLPRDMSATAVAKKRNVGQVSVYRIPAGAASLACASCRFSAGMSTMNANLVHAQS
jgi:hypothetical protein